MSVQDVVNLTITLISSFPTKAGFGTALILSGKSSLPTWGGDLVRKYSAADDMLTDGFTSDDIEYKFAVALKSQRPSPPSFKVGRLGFAPVQTIEITPTAQNNGVYSGKFNSLPFTFTADASATVAEITAGLTTAITALAGVTAADNTTKVTATTDTAGFFGQYTELTKNLAVKDVTPDPGDFAAALAAIDAFDSDYYAILCPYSAETLVNELAGAVETRRKLLVVASADSDLKTSSTTDLGSDLAGTNRFRTSVFYHQDVGSTLAAAITGQRLTSVPGSDTWAFKELSGVTASTLTTAEATFLKNKSVNYYVSLAGVGSTLWGTVASGDYLDIVRGIDHLFARIQEDVLGLFQANEKVPYTNKGAQALVGVVQSQLDSHAKDPINFLTNEPPDAPVASAPDVRTISPAVKATRRLPDVIFSGKVQGAIHAVDIRGTVSI
jgi:hypothetical protein